VHVPASSNLQIVLGAEVWGAVIQVAERVELRAGDPLIRQGTLNDAVFFIERGELGISLGPGDDSNDRVALGTRNEGHWVGEIGWLEPGPATAHVVATRDSVVYELRRDAWLQLSTLRPGIAAQLVRAVSEDLARRIRNAGVVLEGPTEPPRTGSSWARWLESLFGGGAG